MGVLRGGVCGNEGVCFLTQSLLQCFWTRFWNALQASDGLSPTRDSWRAMVRREAPRARSSRMCFASTFTPGRQPLSLCSGVMQPGPDSFLNQGSFKFGHCANDLEH